jgi:hypothetical protein
MGKRVIIISHSFLKRKNLLLITKVKNEGKVENNGMVGVIREDNKLM